MNNDRREQDGELFRGGDDLFFDDEILYDSSPRSGGRDVTGRSAEGNTAGNNAEASAAPMNGNGERTSDIMQSYGNPRDGAVYGPAAGGETYDAPQQEISLVDYITPGKKHRHQRHGRRKEMKPFLDGTTGDDKQRQQQSEQTAQSYERVQQQAPVQPAQSYERVQQQAPVQPAQSYERTQQAPVQPVQSPVQPVQSYEQMRQEAVKPAQSYERVQQAPVQPAQSYERVQQQAPVQPVQSYERVQQQAPVQSAQSYEQMRQVPAETVQSYEPIKQEPVETVQSHEPIKQEPVQPVQSREQVQQQPVQPTAQNHEQTWQGPVQAAVNFGQTPQTPASAANAQTQAQSRAAEHKETRIITPPKKADYIMLAVIAAALVMSLLSLNSYTHTSSDLQALSWMKLYNNEIHNLTSEVLSDAIYIKKEYVIPETALAGAVPASDGYGKDEDSSLDEAVDQALVYGLMQSPDMVYSKDLELYEGQSAEYYIDETIFTVLWKERIYDCVANFAEVYIADASQLRRKLSQNQYASPVHMRTSALAKSTNAVVAMSGDFYGYRNTGCTVYQRKVYRSNVSGLDICFITGSGDFIIKDYQRKDKISEKDMQKFVDDNDVIFSLSFGPSLIIDGIPQPLKMQYPLGQPEGNYARAAIAQMGTLHYLLCTVDGGVDGEVGTDLVCLMNIMTDKGCVNAYTLDGGQTATIFFNSKVFNRVGYGSERNISDIVYFASANGETGAADE